MFESSYRFNLSRSGIPTTALGNSEEIQLALIPQPSAFACAPKNDESYGDATRVIAVFKSRIERKPRRTRGRLVGNVGSKEGEQGRVRAGGVSAHESSWRKGIYCPLHHFTGS